LDSEPVRTFLGVDGGGTKTDFLLIDESGRVLATRRAGSAYYLEIGADALQRMLVAGIKDTLGEAAVSPADLTYAFMGLPAYGEDGALLARFDRIASELLPTERCRCANDVVCGWAGALAGHDGINIVAGTGSIAYGEFASRSARAGGWGELFGDEGSAYWVAREALNLFSRMSDGRLQRGPLYDLVREHFRVRDDLDVCAALYGPPPLTRSEVAALAPLVARAVRGGDVAALRIFEAAARELAAVVHAVRDELAVPPQVSLPVSYSGGMFQLDNLVLPLLQAALLTGGRQYEFAAPRLSPGAGAALYAAKLAGAPLTEEAVHQLMRTHAAFPVAPIHSK
jgi:N-acetylglucosamine kinase-like BadF-type ATPase